ncbi:MAG: hypothetical protein Q9191_005751, partial [Dirinaria sp. TL-2023a]
MQAISFLSILLALSVSALPSTQNHTLETRISHHPWIGSSSTNNCNMGPMPGPRPKIRNGCVAFTPQTLNVELFWGWGKWAINKINVYNGTVCDNVPWLIINKPTTHNGGSCYPVPTGQPDWGIANWGS